MGEHGAHLIPVLLYIFLKDFWKFLAALEAILLALALVALPADALLKANSSAEDLSVLAEATASVFCACAVVNAANRRAEVAVKAKKIFFIFCLISCVKVENVWC